MEAAVAVAKEEEEEEQAASAGWMGDSTFFEEVSLAQEMPSSPIMMETKEESQQQSQSSLNAEDEIVSNSSPSSQKEESGEVGVGVAVAGVVSKKRKKSPTAAQLQAEREESMRKRAKSWLQENRKQLLEQERLRAQSVYDITMLGEYRKMLERQYKGYDVVLSYVLPLFDFLGTDKILFQRIVEFDGVVKGYTTAATDRLQELVNYMPRNEAAEGDQEEGRGEIQESIMTWKELNQLELKFAKKWWKLPVDSARHKNDTRGVRAYIGVQNVTCILTGVKADVPLTKPLIHSKSRSNKGDVSSSSSSSTAAAVVTFPSPPFSEEKNIIFVKPLVRWEL